METATAIVLGTLAAIALAGFGGVGWMLRRIDAKLDRVAERLTLHEIECAKRWQEHAEQEAKKP